MLRRRKRGRARERASERQRRGRERRGGRGRKKKENISTSEVSPPPAAQIERCCSFTRDEESDLAFFASRCILSSRAFQSPLPASDTCRPLAGARAKEIGNCLNASLSIRRDRSLFFFPPAAPERERGPPSSFGKPTLAFLAQGLCFDSPFSMPGKQEHIE